MLARILRHEWRVLRAERTLPLLCAGMALCAAYAARNGAVFQAVQQREQQQALQPVREELQALRAALDRQPPTSPGGATADARSPRYVGGIAQPLALPARPLLPLATGQADLLPGLAAASIWTSPRTALRNYEVQNPTHLLAGRFDAAFVLVWLFPLAVLALSYDLLSAERDEGLLALVLAQPVTLPRLVLGKVLLRLLLVGAAGLGAWALAALVAQVPLGAPGAAADLAWGALLLTAYAGFWFTLAVGVAALRRSAAASAVILASLWLLLVVVLPSLLGLASNLLYPVPSRLELVQASREATNVATPQAESLVRGHYSDHPELARSAGDPDLRDFMVRFLTVEAYVERQVARVAAEHETRLRQRQDFVAHLRFLSPALVLHDALSELAGTHTRRYQRFREQAQDFVARWKGFFAARIYARATLTRADWEALPRFAFAEEAQAERHARAAAALAGLLAPTLLLTLLATRRLRTYRVAG